MIPAWRPDFAATPPFLPLQTWTAHLAGPDWPGLDSLNQLAAGAGLVNATGLAVHFQRQEQRHSQRDYEASILASGRVPTRERNWHDLLNALCWLAFPRAKAALNAIQCRALAPGQPRGPASDAATLFDESGLILVGPESGLASLLAGRRWREAFVDSRPAWQEVRALAIGHAVLEKLLDPWPGITAKCLYLTLENDAAGADWQAGVDQRVADLWLQGELARPDRLFPMPVLGIPGWWPANEDPGFYDDREVFRPPRA